MEAACQEAKAAHSNLYTHTRTYITLCALRAPSGQCSNHFFQVVMGPKICRVAGDTVSPFVPVYLPSLKRSSIILNYLNCFVHKHHKLSIRDWSGGLSLLCMVNLVPKDTLWTYQGVGVICECLCHQIPGPFTRKRQWSLRRVAAFGSFGSQDVTGHLPSLVITGHLWNSP